MSRATTRTVVISSLMVWWLDFMHDRPDVQQIIRRSVRIGDTATKLRNSLCIAKSSDVWVGLFVLLGVAALLFLALKAGNMSTLSFSKTYAVTGKFDNIGGLKPQAPVKSAGVVVGRVGDISFDDKTLPGAGDAWTWKPATSSRKTAR